MIKLYPATFVMISSSLQNKDIKLNLLGLLVNSSIGYGDNEGYNSGYGYKGYYIDS